jgi:PiT family inorganic phosphate transporter
VFRAHAGASPPPSNAAAARATVGYALKTKDANRPEVYAALAVVTGDIARQVSDFGAIMAVPAAATTNVRNDMYLASDAVRVIGGAVAA